MFPARPTQELEAALLPPCLGDWITAVEFATIKTVKDVVVEEGCVPDSAYTEAYTEAVSASWDHSIRIWEIETGVCVESLVGHTDGVRCLCVVEGGERILSGGMDRSVRMWRRDGYCEQVTRLNPF